MATLMSLSTGLNQSAVTVNTTTPPSNFSRLCYNDSLSYNCSNQTSNFTQGMYSDESSLDALLYIVVVLLFYAFSIVVLMVKYIRRENKEAYLRQYFEEFVTREKFQSAQARNKIMNMKSLLDRQTNLDPQGQVMSRSRDLDAPLFIPEAISELEEVDGEELDVESAEDELNEEVAQVDGTAGIDIDSSNFKTVPQRATPV